MGDLADKPSDYYPYNSLYIVSPDLLEAFYKREIRGWHRVRCERKVPFEANGQDSKLHNCLSKEIGFAFWKVSF